MFRWNHDTKGSLFFTIWQGAQTITKKNYLLKANRQYRLVYVRDKGVGVGAPTLRGEKTLILQKGVLFSANYFLNMIFIHHGLSYLLGDFRKIGFSEVSWPRCRDNITLLYWKEMNSKYVLYYLD